MLEYLIFTDEKGNETLPQTSQNNTEQLPDTQDDQEFTSKE